MFSFRSFQIRRGDEHAEVPLPHDGHVSLHAHPALRLGPHALYLRHPQDQSTVRTKFVVQLILKRADTFKESDCETE